MMRLIRHAGRKLVLVALFTSLLALVTFAAGSVAVSPASAQSIEEFYKGKTVTISVGFSPGGSYDFYSRLVARYKIGPGVVRQAVNLPPAEAMRPRRRNSRSWISTFAMSNAGSPAFRAFRRRIPAKPRVSCISSLLRMSW